MKKLLNIKNQRIILISIITLMIITNLFRCNKLDKNEVMYAQNIAALLDTIRSYESINGTLVYEKKSLITSSKELEKYNSELANEIKYLNANPIIITKFKTSIVHDTIEIPVYMDHDEIKWSHDSTVVHIPYKWSKDTVYAIGNYRNISGDFIAVVDTLMTAHIKDFKINTDEIGLSFTTGISEKDKMIEIFIRSDYPGFFPTGIDGALIDPRESKVIKSFFPPKRWGIGVFGGYGVYVDPLKGRAGHSMQVGLGITYSIIQFNLKK